jgi:hypothetical protein
MYLVLERKRVHSRSYPALNPFVSPGVCAPLGGWRVDVGCEVARTFLVALVSLAFCFFAARVLRRWYDGVGCGD